MSRVRFHDICDRCWTHGEEYTAMATCRECGLTVCTGCSTDPDAETGSAMCKACVEPSAHADCAEQCQLKEHKGYDTCANSGMCEVAQTGAAK